MKTRILFLTFLCAAACLSAQTVNDSLRLEITNVTPFRIFPDAPQNYRITLAIENRTKEFKYSLLTRELPLTDIAEPCWRVKFELEYKDGTRETCQAAGIFFVKDKTKERFLMPGERRTDSIQLIQQYAIQKGTSAIDYPTRPLSDIRRIRAMNGIFIWCSLVTPGENKHNDEFHTYGEGSIISNWYDVDFK